MFKLCAAWFAASLLHQLNTRTTCHRIALKQGFAAIGHYGVVLQVGAAYYLCGAYQRTRGIAQGYTAYFLTGKPAEVYNAIAFYEVYDDLLTHAVKTYLPGADHGKFHRAFGVDHSRKVELAARHKLHIAKVADEQRIVTVVTFKLNASRLAGKQLYSCFVYLIP